METPTPVQLCFSGLSFFHGISDNPDNGHQHTAADTTAGNAANDAPDIHAATSGAHTKQTKQLATQSTTQNTGDGIAQCAQG